MSQQLLNDDEQTYYVVKVNGLTVTQPVSTKFLAEMEKSKLPPEARLIAEVVQVTSDGRQVLFG